MLNLVRKEITALFSSLVAYITIGLFLLACGLFLWIYPDSSILEYGYAGLDRFFDLAPYLLMFLVPAITMRTLAAERKEGTFEFLSTLPLSDWQIVGGKYLACLVVLVLTLIPTVIYYITIYQLGVSKGNVDTGAVTGSYLGLFLLGAGFVAIGLFSSSVTKNQVIAFVTAVFFCFFMFSGFDSLSRLLFFRDVELFVTSLGMNEHYEAISRGVLDTRDLLYFISLIAVSLVSAMTVLGGRKW
jgi:ABC-2 type transport system permease protein